MNPFSLKFKQENLEAKFIHSQQQFQVGIHKAISICLLCIIFLHSILKTIDFDEYKVIRNVALIFLICVQYFYFQKKKPHLIMIPLGFIHLALVLMNFESEREIFFFLWGIVEMTIHFSLLQDPRFLVNCATICTITIIQIIFANYYLNKFSLFSLLLLVSMMMLLASNYFLIKNKRSLFLYMRKDFNWGTQILKPIFLGQIYKETIPDPYFVTSFNQQNFKFSLLESNQKFDELYLHGGRDQFTKQIRKIKISQKMNLEQYISSIIKNEKYLDQSKYSQESNYQNHQIDGNFIDEINNTFIRDNLKIQIFFKKLDYLEFTVFLHSLKEDNTIKLLMIHQVALEKIMKFTWNFVSRKGFELDNNNFKRTIYQLLNQILNLSFQLKPNLANSQYKLKKFNLFQSTKKVLEQMGIQDKIKIQELVCSFHNNIISQEEYYNLFLYNILSQIRYQSVSLIFIDFKQLVINNIQFIDIQFKYQKKRQVKFKLGFDIKKINANSTQRILKKISPQIEIFYQQDEKTNIHSLTFRIFRDLRVINKLKQQKQLL